MVSNKKMIAELIFVYENCNILNNAAIREKIDNVIKLIKNSHLTSEEIDFLLMSEEERVNTYKNYEEIWKSCVCKLERQKEVLHNGQNY